MKAQPENPLGLDSTLTCLHRRGRVLRDRRQRRLCRQHSCTKARRNISVTAMPAEGGAPSASAYLPQPLLFPQSRRLLSLPLLLGLA